MDLLKDISSLNSKIDDLRQTIADYDRQLKSSAGMSKSLEQMFAGFKNAKAGSMDVNMLADAVRQLSNGYNELTTAQSAAMNRQKALISEMKLMEELQTTIASAQRDALSNGDQQGAANLYQQYVATGKAMSDLRAEVELTGSTIVSLNDNVSSSEQTLNRYNQVLESATKASNTNSIAELNALFEEEKQKVQKVCDAISEYKEKYETIKSVQDGGGLNPKGMEKAQAELTTYTNELQRLSEEYARAAENAQIYADALGLDGGGSIPEMPELPKLDGDDTEKAAKNMKDYADAAGDASTKLEDLFKKGAALGGLTYGVHKLKELGQQVMHTRSEFQQLEVAFTTMLGSKDKADALMQQLTKTAATTPFDLQSVSRGAKQLLAYGTAAGDVNDILIHLGDVAAGLSQPLDALVYLYGTTMVQGKMMTRDLLQFQNRGIPIAEELAKQFGVAKSEVQGLVSAGRVTADEFHKAVMGMASDGGKFAGLMAAQSKTIGGQISNIEDSIDMMFNEIGKSSEGIINMGLSGVSKLVENYENVGRTILNLVAVYGTYKTALIIVSALEAARAKQAKFAVVTGGKQITITNLLVKSTYKQIAAQLKLNAAMLANPATWIALGLAALVTTIIVATRAMENSAKITEKVNKKYDERVSKLNEEKDAAEQHIAVLKDETAANYQLMKAKDALSKMDLLKGKNIAGMTPEMIQQELDKAYQEQLAKAKEEELQGYKESIAKGASQYGNFFSGKKIKNTIVQDSADAIEGLSMNEFDEFAKDKTYEEKLDFINAKIKEQNAILEERNAQLTEYNSLNSAEKSRKYQNVEGGYLAMAANWEYEFKMAEEWKNNWLRIQENIKDAEEQRKKKDEEENTGISLNKVIYGYTTQDKEGKDTFVNGIVQQEKEVEKLRKQYAAKASNANKKALESAEANLKELTDKYKLATGQTWTSTKEMTKQTEKELRDAARKNIDIQSQEYSKRVQLAEKYKQDLEDLALEQAEWEEKNPNRPVPTSFAKRKAVLGAQYDFDREQLDKEFNEWIEGIERETEKIKLDVDISNIEQSIDLVEEFNAKQAKRREIYDKRVAEQNKDIDKEKQDLAKERFGAKTIEKYNITTDRSTLSAEEQKVFEQIDAFYAAFEEKRGAILSQMAQEHNAEMLRQDLDDYTAYCEEIIAAAKEREDAIAAINSGQETNRTIEMVESDYNARINKASEVHGIDAMEKKASNVVARLINSIADVTYDQVDIAAKKFFDAIGEQETMIKNIKGMDSTTKEQQAQTTQEEIDKLKLEAEIAPNEEARNELLGQIAEKEQYLIYLKMTENELDGEAYKLLNTRKSMETLVANQKQKSGKKTQQELKKENLQYKVTIQSLELVADTAKKVADTFGGALSKKAKKALDTMAGVADFGISAVQGIETIVNGVSNGMIKTTEGASKSMQALEKASVILTIISIAVQLIMKIVEIASQFTKSAQLQNAIDEHLAKVDELKKQQELLEAQYATAQGSKYYEGLAKSAASYNDIIKETKAALEDANALYEHNKATYGEDSDKTQEAKAQRDDLALQDVEFQNSQIEAWRSLMEELSGTSLDSFAENLADALIEGFAMGKEGIDDVWEDTMDDLLRTMMRNELALALKDTFKKTFEDFTDATKDGDLSESDMAEFMANLEKGKETAEQIASAYYDAMSEAGLLDDADAEGSQGFGQMTQDQADTLTARFTAVQIEMANVSAATQAMAGVVSLVGEDIKLGVAGIQSLLYNSNIALQMAQDQLDQMQIIADNTAMLAETNTRLKAIEQNTGRL